MKTYVFVGQNASTGSPNPNTGRMSFFGSIYAFKTRKDALDFADDHYSPYAQDIIAVGGVTTMRKYCQGSTVRNFKIDLDQVPVLEKDSYFGWL